MRAFVFGQVGRWKTRSGIIRDELSEQRGHTAATGRGFWGIDEGLFSPAPAVGVFMLVLWINPADDMAALRIGEIDVGKIPGCIPQGDALEVPIARRKLEADAIEAYGLVALALLARDPGGESLTQRFAVGTGTAYVLCSDKLGKGRLAKL